MNRFAWLLTAGAVLLTGCGGGVSSPDFQGQLVGVDILYPNSTASNPKAVVMPGSTLQFSAVGLYSAPPGTPSSTAGVVPCPSASDSTRVCRQGSIDGVTWSLDSSSTGIAGPIATINATGLVSGLRRGTGTVRARVANLEDAVETVIVNGAVLRSIAITATDVKNNVTATSVPTGRSFVLTGVATCESGYAGGSGDELPNSNAPCTNLDYQFSWALPATTDQATVEFLPTSRIGESIAVKTKKFGPFQIVASFVNEEGIRKEATIPLSATERVLDDIVVAADPVQAAPVPVVIGAQTRFVAKGVFSDGNTDDIREGDLKASTALVWTQDASSVGKITIQNATGSPNAAVLVSGDVVGITGLTAKGFNTETTPTGGLPLEDRIGVDVKTFGLLGLVDICPFDSIGTECLQNRQLPIGSTTKFKVRGRFQDNPSVARDIDPTKISLTWSKTVTPSTGDVTVVSAGTPAVTTGEFVATRQGTVTLNVAISDVNVEPAANPRQISTTATVTEAVCRDQLLTSNGTSGTGSSNNVRNIGNAIDSNADSFATVSVTPPLLLIGGEESLSLQRTATSVIPTPSRSVGFILAPGADFNADASAQVETLDAAGNVVQRLAVASSSLPSRNGEAVVAAKASATLPFTGLRLVASAPTSEPSGTPLDILLGPLFDLLTGGGSVDIHVYGACADFAP